MKYIIINLSPREKGTSKMLTDYFAKKITSNSININSVDTCNLYSYLKDIDIVLNKIKLADSIVMIGPCYVNSYPAETINLLYEMSNANGVLHGQSMYAFIQGGMPYVHTHEHGSKLIENFCNKENLTFKGGFVMGGGATLDGQPLDKILGAKKMVPAVDKFIEHIQNDEQSPEELYKNATMKIPYLITKMLSIVLSNNVKKSLDEKSIDYTAKSPYSNS